MISQRLNNVFEKAMDQDRSNLLKTFQVKTGLVRFQNIYIIELNKI